MMYYTSAYRLNKKHLRNVTNQLFSTIVTMQNTSGSNQKIVRLAREPVIIPRDRHCISRSAISDNALKVLYRLKNAGFKSYLVGGCVRDLLLGIKPKDFDVVTDALPEQIRELFRNSRLIGRRFRLAHVRYGDEIIEVSTFRASHTGESGDGHSEDGRIIRDNVYGDIDDDVWRRDFTINALFYNIEDFTIVDYVGGLQDIEQKQLRLIGDPVERYREDPVRMLRAIRFAAKLGFSIHPASAGPVCELNNLLAEISSSRLFEEFMKLFMNGAALKTYQLLREYNLFEYLFPDTSELLLKENGNEADRLIQKVLINTDTRLEEDKPITPGFLLAAILWPSLQIRIEEHLTHGLAEYDAIILASDTVISRQVSSLSIPRRFTMMSRDIWSLQYRLKSRKGNKPARLLSHPKYKAAYDFLLLRAESGEPVEDLVKWWTEFMQSNEHLLADPGNRPQTFRPKPRRRRKRVR